MITMEHVSFGYGESQETLSQVSMAVAPEIGRAHV